MAKTKEQKQAMLKAMTDKFEIAKSVIFASFDKLTVSENNELRDKLKEEKNEFLVAKKTILNLALKNQKQKDVDISDCKGQVAAIFGYEDEVSPARIVKEFRKEHEEKIDFLGGILENKFIGNEKVSALADLPGKDELRAKLVGSLNAPISGFANVLAGNIRSFSNVLNAIKTQKEA
ncbi:MAG: 50S ribosomal protein L10 [Patescibacteria group bacterium]|nr:50S ribosomal protein L10 [Patescibacteria group bacterium]